jgi:hypothetical protein
MLEFNKPVIGWITGWSADSIRMRPKVEIWWSHPPPVIEEAARRFL